MMKYISILLLVASTAVAKTSDQQGTMPDNTKRNASEQVTAENQGRSVSDREITRHIRRSLVKTDSLTSMGKNVKVITIGGQVTLKGPVHSQQEKATINSIAQRVAGSRRVTDQLEVKQSQ